MPIIPDPGPTFSSNSLDFKLIINGFEFNNSFLDINASTVRGGFLTNGENEIIFIGADSTGRSFFSVHNIWAGSTTLHVYLVDSANNSFLELKSV